MIRFGIIATTIPLSESSPGVYVTDDGLVRMVICCSCSGLRISGPNLLIKLLVLLLVVQHYFAEITILKGPVGYTQSKKVLQWAGLSYHYQTHARLSSLPEFNKYGFCIAQ